MVNGDTQKRVLITGCSSGFGLLTAVEAAKAGFDCIATMRNMTKADYLRGALKQADAGATIERLDVTDAESARELVAKYAPIDILVNNAGILIMGSALDITEEEMRRIFETNYFGAVRLTRAVAGQMIEAGGGLIINVASLAGLVGHPFNAAYAATKHALIGFSRSLRLELRPFNIDVVSVEPGYHRTEIIRANANLTENFYDKQSPTFEYNRGFLKLMLDEIVPRAADADRVAKKIVEIMQAEKRKPHYVIGKDAKWLTIAKWLGLTRYIEDRIYKYLLRATRRENRRAQAKKEARGRKTEDRA
ncbi:MAG: short-chain dehydrogenase [Planctomycetota bacterium]|nr:MAG: short-chain dehydrogenase [Planctomycetota bacterium]